MLGAGMHEWGKWGRPFVEYGLAAARDALADAGLGWRDMQFVSGADTIRNGYPGFVSGATFAQALGLDRGPGLERLRRLRLGRGGHRQRPGPDPGRAVRRRAGGRRRHHAEGLLRPGRRRRAQGRPGLAALPSDGRDQPDLLRASTRVGAWTASAPPRRTSHRSR